MRKDHLNRKRGHAIIGFNDGLPWYVKNLALGPQSRQQPRPTASVFVYLSPSGHVFNIAWQAMIKTLNMAHKDIYVHDVGIGLCQLVDRCAWLIVKQIMELNTYIYIYT